MLLAGKSREKCADQNKNLHKVTCSINIHISAEEPSRVTFSFDKQDGGVGVGRRLHLSNQSFLLIVLLFFCLQTHTNHFGSVVPTERLPGH